MTWAGHSELSEQVRHIVDKIDMLKASVAEGAGASKTRSTVLTVCLALSCVVIGIVSTRSFMLSDSVKNIDTRVAVAEKTIEVVDKAILAAEEREGEQERRHIERLTAIEKLVESVSERCKR